MASSSSARWVVRPNFRSGRYRRSKQPATHEDNVKKINVNEADPRQSIEEFLLAICQKTDMSDTQRLNYLNAFVKVTLFIDGNFERYGYKIIEILLCLRLTLWHESTQIRTGGLRAIRHVLRNDDDVILLNKLSIPFLIARSLDLVVKHDIERIEALKLIRKVMLLSPGNFHASLGRSIIALANEDTDEKDRLLRICLVTLCELGVLCTDIFIEGGGVSAIMKNLLECQIPKVSESLCGVLLLLLDKPATRDQVSIDLHVLGAAYCEFEKRQSTNTQEQKKEEHEHFNCSRLALLSLLRSWPGMIYFCNPNNSSGFKAIVDALFVNELEVRKAVLDLLYELLGLPLPEWTDELSVALNAIDPSRPQPSWHLTEGFVVAEGRTILPHLSKTMPKVNDMHMAFLVYSLMECGLLSALVEVIATSDTFISVRTTVLLGQLLHLIQFLLPLECCNITASLPTLFGYTVKEVPQALAAVSGLQQLHRRLQRRPTVHSPELDFILRSGQNSSDTNTKHKKNWRRFSALKCKLQNFIQKDGDDTIRDSGVLAQEDALRWNWNIVRLILRGESTRLDIQKSSHRLFLRRIVNFYKPSSSRFSKLNVNPSTRNMPYAIAGIDLMLCLLDLEGVSTTKTMSSASITESYSDTSSPSRLFYSHSKYKNDSSSENMRLLYEWLTDIVRHIVAIYDNSDISNDLFDPDHLDKTYCQTYFLMLGRLATIQTGMNILNSINVFEHLVHIAHSTTHDCYVKLILGSLDYSYFNECRQVLQGALTNGHPAIRLYATQFMLVLLRAGLQDFHDWGIRLLVERLEDHHEPIYMSALNTLQEACEVDACLSTLLELRPNLDRLGERGNMLRVRYWSQTSGVFQSASSGGEGGIAAYWNAAVQDLKYWNDYFNFRYVKILEDDISDALTLHQRDIETGKYEKRLSAASQVTRQVVVKDAFVLPHIYGQMALQPDGFKLLLAQGSVDLLLQIIEQGACDTDQEILSLKSALWAIGHFGSTCDGLTFLRMNGGVACIIDLAQHSLVYSIRATAYYVLGLIATTKLGADELLRLGWFCTRHNRHTLWSIDGGAADWSRFCNSSDKTSSFDILTQPVDSLHTASADGQYSSGNVMFDLGLCEFECSTDEEITTSESQRSATPSEGPPESDVLCAKNKSSTLPINCSLNSANHKRSMSESKTFETFHKTAIFNSAVTSGVPLASHLVSSCRTNCNVKVETISVPISRRLRNNSTTESTTSGVSSCESVCGASKMHEHQQILSPIPSSCSLSTMKQAKTRRHSESCRHISSGSPSDKSVLPGSYPNKLTPEGISCTLLRSFRKSPVASQHSNQYIDGSILTEGLNETLPYQSTFYSSWLNKRLTVLNRIDGTINMVGNDEDLVTQTSNVGSNAMSTSCETIPRDFNGRCYMGVCLPIDISKVFGDMCILGSAYPKYVPLGVKEDKRDDDNATAYRCHQYKISHFFMAEEDEDLRHELLVSGSDSDRNLMDSYSTTDGHRTKDIAVIKHLPVWVEAGLTKSPPTQKWSHCKEACYDCTAANIFSSICTTSSLYGDVPSSFSKFEFGSGHMEVLRLIDNVNNPVWLKPVRQALLLLKQAHPQLFQTLCMFSEACNLMAATTVRLNGRRLLYELFSDLNTARIHDATVAHLQMLIESRKSVQTLDSLKLVYKENKFPVWKERWSQNRGRQQAANSDSTNSAAT